MLNLNVIIAPVISEKSTKGIQDGKFTFKVEKTATKGEIKRAIERQFKVNVLKVKTSIVKGRQSRVGVRRVEVSQSSFKKAIVTLKKGQKIDIFEVAG